MSELSGLGKLERKQLAAVIRGTKGSITVSDAAEILQITPARASMKLSNWTRKGWLSRIKRGLYAPVPLESLNVDVPLEDPWIIADRLYAPCYIGGWTAAEYWDLTEQIFRSVFVMTTRNARESAPEIKGTRFQIRRIKDKAMFGLKPVWRGEVKVLVSDPSRTIVDFLNDPRLGGGIRATVDVMKNYLKSKYKNPELLFEYAKQLNRGVVFKRLGFVLEMLLPDAVDVIEKCRVNLTKGNSKLDPKLSADNLVTRWRLWVPRNWKKEI